MRLAGFLPDTSMSFISTAYSHDTSRDELIARFRDRIATGERTKLTKTEREELALHFIDRLAKCKTETDAISLCKEEIALLEEGYPVASIANQYLPEWRKLITLAVDEGRLPKQDLEPNEFGKVYPHWGLKYLLYPNVVQKAIKERTTVSNNQKQDDLKPIRADRFLTKAKDLINGNHPYEWAVGLLAVTGRRFSEIVAKGQFFATNHPYAIAFRGQLKKGIQNSEEAETFLIATLVDSRQVLAAIDKLRTHPRIQELSDLTPDEINSRLNTSVRLYIKRDFEDPEIVPILTGEKSVSAHNLRGVYAEIAVHFFCPPNQGTHRFLQQHLGHVIGESELARRKNAGATEHYFHYYLIGAQGQALGEKGILLERVGMLPTSIQWIEPDPTEEITPATMASKQLELQQPSQAQSEEEQKVAITQKQATMTRVPVELMHELKQVAAEKLNIKGSYAEVLDAVIEFLVDDKTPTIAASVESFGSTFQWFTSEIERLREQVEQLTEERDQALANPQDQDELETLRAENAQLKAEVAQFQQLKQLLIGNGALPTPTPPITATPTPVFQPKPQRTPVIAEEKPRRVSEELATSRVDEAISLIMSWNDTPNRAFGQKWFISVPVLQQLLRGSGYSASQGRVQEALANRRNEIEEHHRKHGLGQRHNVRHQQPITENITM